MKSSFNIITIFLCFISYQSFAEQQASINNTEIIFSSDEINIEFPKIILKDIETKIKIILNNPEQIKLYDKKEIKIFFNDKLIKLEVSNGIATLRHKFTSKKKITIKIAHFIYSRTVNPIPLWLSILPPLLAILIALLFREVYTALFIGILSGTSVIYFYQEQSIFIAFFKGLFAVVDTYILQAMNDASHLSIIIFSMLIGATVILITSNGGMKGVVNKLSKYANTAKSGQLVTWLLGIIIFFDDYANTLVVGNTMRPITDRLKISREKLSYLVDSTAAPVAAIAFVTTWIGAELGYIENAISNIAPIRESEGVFSIFISSLQYSFYPIFTLIFIFILIMKSRDYGPMLRAEKKARTSEMASDIPVKSKDEEFEVIEAVKEAKPRWFNAVIPIAFIVFTTIIGLFYSGFCACKEKLCSLSVISDDSSFITIWNNLQFLHNTPDSFFEKLGTVIGASDSYSALLWASLLGLCIAILLTVSQRIMNIKRTIVAVLQGFKTMLGAILILILAWALAIITEDMHTADFITGLMGQNISPWLIPAMTFILASLVAFSTGSSWGTMAILYPLMLPLAWKVCQASGYNYDSSMMIFYNVVSCVLAGSVLGDHCSPISDTTILSSLASSCNHIDHVKTQLPYAITVGAVAVIFGTIPAAFGISSFILMPVGIIALYFIVVLFGKKVE